MSREELSLNTRHCSWFALWLPFTTFMFHNHITIPNVTNKPEFTNIYSYVEKGVLQVQLFFPQPYKLHLPKFPFLHHC